METVQYSAKDMRKTFLVRPIPEYFLNFEFHSIDS